MATALRNKEKVGSQQGEGRGRMVRAMKEGPTTRRWSGFTQVWARFDYCLFRSSDNAGPFF